MPWLTSGADCALCTVGDKFLPHGLLLWRSPWLHVFSQQLCGPKSCFLGKFTHCFGTLSWHRWQWDPLCPSNRAAEAMVLTEPPKCLVGWVSFTLGPWLWQGVMGTRGVTLHPPSPWPALTGELWLRGTPWQVPACCWPGRSVPQPNPPGPSLAPGTSSCRSRAEEQGTCIQEGGGQVLAAEMLSAGLSAGSAPCRSQGVGCETHLPLGAFGGKDGRGCFWGYCPTLLHP